MIDDPDFVAPVPVKPAASRRRALTGRALVCIILGAIVGAVSLVSIQYRGPHDTTAGVNGAFLGAGFGYFVDRTSLFIPFGLAIVFGAFIYILGPGVDADPRMGIFVFFVTFVLASCLDSLVRVEHRLFDRSRRAHPKDVVSKTRSRPPDERTDQVG